MGRLRNWHRLLQLLGAVAVVDGLVTICANATPDGSACSQQAFGVTLLLAGIAAWGTGRALVWWNASSRADRKERIRS
jgi:hypothetical protein